MECLWWSVKRRSTGGATDYRNYRNNADGPSARHFHPANFPSPNGIRAVRLPFRTGALSTTIELRNTPRPGIAMVRTFYVGPLQHSKGNRKVSSLVNTRAALVSLHNNPECDKNPRSSVSVRTTFGVFTGNYTCFLPILEQVPDRVAAFLSHCQTLQRSAVPYPEALDAN